MLYYMRAGGGPDAEFLAPALDAPEPRQGVVNTCMCVCIYIYIYIYV